MKGCVWLVVFFLALAVGGYVFLTHTPLRGSIGLSLVTASLVTVTVATLWSVALSLRQWRAMKPTNEWEDGSLVGFSGRLSTTEPLPAPGSGTPSVIYEYSATVRRGGSRADGSGSRATTRTSSEAFYGAGMAACKVESRAGSFRLIGFPLLAELTPKYLDSFEDLRRFSAHLLRADLKPRCEGCGKRSPL